MTDNELIAEFMGLEKFQPDEKYNLEHWRIPTNDNTRAAFIGYGHQLKYHESWDWLMPVVERIEGMGYCARIVRSGGERCVIYDPEVHNSADVAIGKGFGASINQDKKIEAIYKAVVEFIKWHNEQKD